MPQPAFEEELNWLDGQRDAMVDLVVRLANMNSGTYHLEGIDRVRNLLGEQWGSIGGELSEIELADHETIDSRGELQAMELANSLSIRTRLQAARRVFLCIHMDTVYGKEHAFQSCDFLNSDRLQGPGVADAKGGLVVLLFALRALEQSSLAANIGWEVFLNSDEEIGSPGSANYLARRASEFDFGLLFEPSLPDGTLVSQRKGSGNFSVIIRGKSAHAGREFRAGRNAITHLARLVDALDGLNKSDDMTINVGHVQGGGPVNVVPDLAIAKLNVRVDSNQRQEHFLEHLRQLVKQFDSAEGFSCESDGKFYSPAKVPDQKMSLLQREIETSGAMLGEAIAWRDTGGVCDGNKLAAAGLANIDTLGPCGGGIHSPDEFLLVNSLVPRAKLAALMMLRYAAGEFNLDAFDG